MVNRGAVTVTPGSSDQPIPEGYHNGSGKVTAMATTGTAVPADVLAGKTFMNSSGATTGTMTTRGAVTITPGTSDQPILAGHHNGSGKVSGDPDLTSGNIKAGTNIFGVTGNSNVVDTSSGDATAQQLLVGKIAHVDGNQIVGTRPKIYGCLPPAFPPPINWNISQCQNDCLADLHTFGDPTHCIALCDNLALIPDVVTQLCQL
ncbi:MAG: hypothetical protein GY702_10970 [Desulfobulbaceae bacterium]|nr:hypothetical protein [Desulfobulbaceae bacterium]